MFIHFDEGLNTYGYTVMADWDYTQDRPYRGDTIKGKRRIYIHYYYSIEQGADHEQLFGQRIAGLYKELLEGKMADTHQKAYSQFFEVKINSKRGRQVYAKIIVYIRYLKNLMYWSASWTHTMH